MKAQYSTTKRSENIKAGWIPLWNTLERYYLETEPGNIVQEVLVARQVIREL